MVPDIRKRMTPEILASVSARYEIAPEGVNRIGGFESDVYSFEKADKAYVLKITHTLRRRPDCIMGELEWLNYVADHGVPVARAITSDNGHWIETVDDGQGGQFLAIAYERAPGHRATADEWNEALFEAWGKVIGRMHALTVQYKVSRPEFKRQEWYEEEQLQARHYLSADDEAIDVIESLVERLRSLPHNREDYGLVHTDFHQGNFHVENGQITAFDFDDIGYTWFINDIAIILYYASKYTVRNQENPALFPGWFLRHFMKGYLSENRLDPHWFTYIQDFIRLRHALLYVILHQIQDESMTDEQRRKLDEHHRQVIEGDSTVELSPDAAMKLVASLLSE